MSRFLMAAVGVFVLGAGAAQAACNPSSQKCLGQPCEKIGLTQMDYDQKNILACLKNEAGTALEWKANFSTGQTASSNVQSGTATTSLKDNSCYWIEHNQYVGFIPCAAISFSPPFKSPPVVSVTPVSAGVSGAYQVTNTGFFMKCESYNKNGIAQGATCGWTATGKTQ